MYIVHVLAWDVWITRAFERSRGCCCAVLVLVVLQLRVHGMFDAILLDVLLSIEDRVQVLICVSLKELHEVPTAAERRALLYSVHVCRSPLCRTK